ncbi:death-inducer obliterator 1 [Vanessa atalanta]|uniref:death-inducer obliterator 1 n=1 Tax=Vanessa atalanta TaxID=42275 RepID=UPI001FCCE192|nr:death-inducer obliterator 1 [Vanessa atalanta]
MSNTVITNYTDLNGPSTKTDSSVVVIVNKDGSLSVDQNLLGTLMGSDGSQAAGISVVRVGHEGRPDDATDSENEDDKVPHVTLSVDSYYNEPDSIIKYDSGAEMLQSLRIETRENSLVGFQNDHCYTPLTSPSQVLPQKSEPFAPYDDPVIEITHTPPPKPVSTPKKITILEQQIIPKGKKIVLNTTEPSIILKGNDLLTKPLPVLTKSKLLNEVAKCSEPDTKGEENTESSSASSSGDSIQDRDSDSDYKDTKDKSGPQKLRRLKAKPRILKSVQMGRAAKADPKVASKLKINKNVIKRNIKEKLLNKNPLLEKKEIDLDSLIPATKVQVCTAAAEQSKLVPKPTLSKVVKKEKKTPAHMTALLSDMTSLFSTPDVIRRVSTENKLPAKSEKETIVINKKPSDLTKPLESSDMKSIIQPVSISKPDNAEDIKSLVPQKTYVKTTKAITNMAEKSTKGYDPMPQLDDASLAQILQDTTSQSMKVQPSIVANVINSPGLAGPLSPTLDLLGGLQPEEDGLTEDLLMHVAQLVESSENLQEVIDKQVLGKVDPAPVKTPVTLPFQQTPTTSNLYASPPLLKSTVKTAVPRKDPIEIVRRDGRVITLPPIEAPATRSSKRKNQVESTSVMDSSVIGVPAQIQPNVIVTPEPTVQQVSKQYTNKKLTNRRQLDQAPQVTTIEKISVESQESWNSEDDPNRLWCICKQPHNNRFMICCDGCEDWFHGKCVNITKAMGQQMEEQGIEWRCPNCVKNSKTSVKNAAKVPTTPKETTGVSTPQPAITKELASKTTCIVCKKPARASSIYCSDACILKHAQDSLGSQTSTSKIENTSGKAPEKPNSESRVIVYERKSGRLLAGPNAPTAENLKTWLQKNPTFEVVRPGTLSAIKPNIPRKKSINEPNKIQTTLNFARIPKKTVEQPTQPKTPQSEPKEKILKVLASPKEEVKVPPQPKTPVTPKSQLHQIFETPKSTKVLSESKKPVRATTSRSQSLIDKPQAVSPSTSRRKDTPEKRSRMSTEDPIRDNVRKALQEQISNRMAESDGPKFTEEEIQQFANDTELELHELFNRDVGMKYKAKYRSLMFNIKDRKNLSLWEKICEHVITPKQLVRLSPEELASQELAQWRDKEAKHQLELIKKSEIDLLAASKTYVLKTHKGEEVMETKESVSTELDPNVAVEDIVTVLNDSVSDSVPNTEPQEQTKKQDSHKKHSGNKKKDKEKGNSSRKKDKESKRDIEKRSSRSSKRKSDIKEREHRSSRRSIKKSRSRSKSKERSKTDYFKEKPDTRDRSRHRSRSKLKSKRQSIEHSRSNSRGRERSRSLRRSSRRSHSRDGARRRDSKEARSRSTRRSTDEKFKNRSRSQEISNKSKNDSTDSDSFERPKSAMMKEVHPEYDPHEPMITSAFSEEDLRKSREDVYEDTYKNDISEYGNVEYDPSKTFSIDANVTLSPPKYTEKQDKSEAESDQEPSSTVEHSAPTVWNGCINMVDVARFYVAAHEVSGNAVDLEEDLAPELDIVGRINPDTVWDYISKMKRASNKDIVILKLQAANDEEKMQYIALYSYLSSRNRLGVVKVTNTATVKDFYIVPIPANTSLPPVLLPLDGPGLGEVKTHLLIAIIIRQRKKRQAPHIPKDIIPAKVARVSRKKSYTPPLSPRRRALPMPTFTSTALSNSVKDKIAASLACADDDEAYSPGSSSGSNSTSAPSLPPNSNTLRSKMEELNRQIEEQKQQILKMTQADSSVSEENEAYSPSRPLTPPTPVVPLDEIALPSNLQEILATIKQRSENTTADVDMRTLPLP